MRPAAFRVMTLLSWLACTGISQADNVGITTARLIETSTGIYTLEVDTSATLLPAFAAPVVPRRFQDSLTTVYETQAAFVLIKYEFSHPETPLTPDDELLLPWGQMGVSLTAQWADGTLQQSLFLRRLDGIAVPIRLLRTVTPAPGAILQGALRNGVRFGLTHLSGWLMILCLGAGMRNRTRGHVLGTGLLGFLAALILYDVNMPPLAPSLLACLFALGCVLLCRALLKDQNAQGLLWVLWLAAGFSAFSTLATEPRLGAGLMLQLGWGLVVLLLSWLLSICLRTQAARCVVLYLAGLLAITGAVHHFRTGLQPPLESSQQILARITAAQMALPGGISNLLTGGASPRPQPKTDLDNPLAAFLTIEAYETRLEILVKVSETQSWPGVTLARERVLSPPDQPTYRDQIATLLTRHVTLTQDGTPLAPSRTRHDFVTMTANGIYNRPEPIDERIDEAILGVTFIYSHPGLPQEAEVIWQFFADNLHTFDMTATDPYGARQTQLERENPSFTWSNKLAGYQPPEISPVGLVIPRWPLLSLGLLVTAGFVCRRGKASRSHGLCMLVLFGAYVTYPFMRMPMAWGASHLLKPSPGEATTLMEELLTNVYRSFDYRQEEAVYDRLALTVAGDQLVDIYLQSRKALELENRGGARGRVDQVQVLDVHSVDKAPGDGYVIDLSWKVSGSVSHFGHTHYRQNRNRAQVTIIPDNGHWRIDNLNVIDEERLL